MKNVSIIDTVSEYGKIKKEIDTAVSRVLESGIYINGPEVKKIDPTNTIELQTDIFNQHKQKITKSQTIIKFTQSI